MEHQKMEKKRVGEYAATYIRSGMTIGLGTGSTVYYTITALAKRIQNEGLKIQAVSTSEQTTKLAESLGIHISLLKEVNRVDLTIDGVDEFDPLLRGIKGGGGALLFEKIVASNSTKNIWVADRSKAVEQLGAFPLPVEVIPMGAAHLINKFRNEGFEPKLRKRNNDEPYFTDCGNYIIDLSIGKIEDPDALNKWLNLLPGVVENGLFIDIVDLIIIPDDTGVSQVKRNES